MKLVLRSFFKSYFSTRKSVPLCTHLRSCVWTSSAKGFASVVVINTSEDTTGPKSHGARAKGLEKCN